VLFPRISLGLEDFHRRQCMASHGFPGLTR
jgi:hypothetical protein